MRELFRRTIPLSQRAVLRDKYFALQRWYTVNIVRYPARWTAQRRFPQLRNYAPIRDAARQRLEAPYQAYIHNVSTPDFPVSLETSILLLILCETYHPQIILDVGSGFSSYVFRLYAASHVGCAVYSFDDDTAWLERTESYLRRMNLSTDNLLPVDRLDAALGDRKADLILHDSGRAVRWNLATTLPQRSKPQTGMILYDDMQRVDYRWHVRKAVRQARGSYLDLVDVTLDHYGRFAALAYGFGQWA